MNRIALYNSDMRRVYNRNKRLSRLKKNISLSILAGIMAVIVAISFGDIFANAESQDSEKTFKYYTSIEVKYGESLWSIAESYMDSTKYTGISAYIQEVMKINSLPNDNIKAGQSIIVPYYSDVYVSDN